MKYVILNASPRPNSNISQMLGIVRNELLACGDKVLYVDVCKLQFRPCIGCMKCRSTHDCVMPDDDAKQVLRLVQDCDALIVGSPCYWGNMTGQLKMLFDRWVYGMMDHSESGYPIPLLKDKKAVILYPVAVQHFIQAICRYCSCTQGSSLLERVQDCWCSAKRRYPQEQRTLLTRNRQMS